MQYRRFGRTERALSVITLGGMRYAGGWDKPRHELPRESIDNCRDCVLAALECGINHFETAWGYSKSEHLYGQVLNRELAVPRDSYYLMTKAGPRTGDEARARVEKQLAALQTDFIDLYAWHGINTDKDLRDVTAKGGPLDALCKLKEEGVIGAIGFSTHGELSPVTAAVETDRFDFINLHYYYFFQRLAPVIAAAAARDMGVFIISPNDKGGRLYDPPDLLRELTAPLTPVQWNARFCLATAGVHTLSFGMTAPEHFQEMLGALPAGDGLGELDREIQGRLDGRLDTDPHARYQGWELRDDPSGINIPEVLRLRRMLKCYDMRGYGEFRYNMFGTQGNWYPGQLCTEERIAALDTSRFPKDFDLTALLRETHEALYRERGGR